MCETCRTLGGGVGSATQHDNESLGPIHSRAEEERIKAAGAFAADRNVKQAQSGDSASCYVPTMVRELGQRREQLRAQRYDIDGKLQLLDSLLSLF